MLDKKLSTAQKYVVLALSADEAVKDKGVVFHYYGPCDLKRRARRHAKEGLRAIINDTHFLEEEINEKIEDKFPFFRRTYLLSQVKSLRNLLLLGDAKPVGEKLVHAVNNILGVNVQRPYDTAGIGKKFSNGHNVYGNSPKITYEIIRGWIEELTGRFKSDMVHRLFRGRDFETFLNKSAVAVARAKKGYPPDYYVYKGGGRGLMYMSDDYRKDKVTAMRTIMHELCPGHHIYYLYREFLLEEGFVDESAVLDLIYSPETPISEGIAENAFLYLDMDDRGLFRRIKNAVHLDQFRKKVLYNAWHRLFIEGNVTKKAAAEYLAEEGGFAKDKAKIWIKFIDDWRIYYPAYPLGADRIRQDRKKFPRQAMFYLYTPKSIPVLDKLEAVFKKGGGYEEKDCDSADLRDGLAGYAQVMRLPAKCRGVYRLQKAREQYEQIREELPAVVERL